MRTIPDIAVLRGFGATESLIHLTGGQREVYRSGEIVLKPAVDDEMTNWVAEFYLNTHSDDFRLPEPVRSENGSFVYEGWQAWKYIEGMHREKPSIEEVELSVIFHEAIAKIPRPSFFDRPDMKNPWTIADKAAWDELLLDYHPRIAPSVELLRQCLRPIDDEPQLIHGDFGGNILFSEELPPAIIDFCPYWRPAAFAHAVIIADAIVWGGADVTMIKEGNRFENFYQHLVRAELRRVIELDTILRFYGRDIVNEIDTHQALIRAILIN